ncbi:hAT transposon superfamily protein [Euphorbia peplus]|nr:hAT transposon superfamily protein [Euphorbia peplus]
MAAKDLLKLKRPSIFWSSCATHTIKLMLQEIGNQPKLKGVIEKAKSFTIFIYAHHKTLSLMRKFTKKRDIVRPGVTRFASAFLTLQSLMEKKNELKAMVASVEWSESKHGKSAKGKATKNIALSHSFWGGVSLCLNVFAPLFKVLRLVDGEQKPSMGFVYGEILKAREDIKKVYKNQEIYYRPILEIDRKGRERLDSPLHLAGYLLNPYYTYVDLTIANDVMVMNGFIECVEIMYENNVELQYKLINEEFPKYLKKEGAFGKPIALKGCSQDNGNYQSGKKLSCH